MVRSPYAACPHPRIDARTRPRHAGRARRLDWRRLPDDGLEPIPHDPVPSTKYDMKLAGPGGCEIFIGPHDLLPADKARHVGEAVAMVVAKTCAGAQDAAEAVDVDYEELPASIPELALRDRRAGGLGRSPDQRRGRYDVRRPEGHRSGLRRRRPCRDDGFSRRPGDRGPLEPRAALADYDPKTGRYTLYAGSGGAVRQKRELAFMLGSDAESLRVLSYDVGGNFGIAQPGLCRVRPRPVGVAAPRPAGQVHRQPLRSLPQRLPGPRSRVGRGARARRGRPVSGVAGRQHLQRRCPRRLVLTAGQGLGAGPRHLRRFPAVSLRALAVFTNTTPTQAYRRSGRPEVTYRDRAADRHRRTRARLSTAVELRRAN